nr:MAG TPA: hypothetical protein [Microviridae sp.]
MNTFKWNGMSNKDRKEWIDGLGLSSEQLDGLGGHKGIERLVMLYGIKGARQYIEGYNKQNPRGGDLTSDNDLETRMRNMFKNWDDMPQSYKDRLLANPYWQQYLNFKPSQWDLTFNTNSVSNKRNDLASRVDEYANTIYQEWQTWNNSLPSTQYSQQFAAGVYPTSESVGNSEMTDTDNAVTPFSYGGQIDPLSAVSALSSLFSTAMSTAGGIMNIITASQNLKNLKLDAEYKEINNEATAFKAANDMMSIIHDPERSSGGATYFPQNTRISGHLDRINQSKNVVATEKKLDKEIIDTVTATNETTATSIFSPNNFSDDTVAYFSDYRKTFSELMKLKVDYEVASTRYNKRKSEMDLFAVEQPGYQEAYVSNQLQLQLDEEQMHKYNLAVNKLLWSYLDNAMKKAESGDLFYQNLLTSQAYLGFLKTLGISDAAAAFGHTSGMLGGAVESLKNLLGNVQ